MKTAKDKREKPVTLKPKWGGMNAGIPSSSPPPLTTVELEEMGQLRLFLDEEVPPPPGTRTTGRR